MVKSGFAGTRAERADPFAVGRPFDVGRPLLQLGDLRLLAGIEPAHMNLILAAAVGEIGDTCAVRRNARRGIAIRAGGERAIVFTVARNNPQIAEARSVILSDQPRT